MAVAGSPPAYGIGCTCHSMESPQRRREPLPVQQAIDRADCVLAIITTAASQMVQGRLSYALEHRKLVIPLLRTDLAPLLARFRGLPHSLRWTIPVVETQIVEFLKEQKLTKDKQQTIWCVGRTRPRSPRSFSLNKGIVVLRIAVVDSSPPHQPYPLGLARELALFFDIVYVPRAVQEELNKKGRFRYRLNKLYSTRFFTRCMTADIFNVQLLQAELDKRRSRGSNPSAGKTSTGTSLEMKDGLARSPRGWAGRQLARCVC